MGAHTRTCLTSRCPRLPWWAGTRKVKPIWILLKQETVSGSGISWAIYKSAPRSRHITTPAPHHSVFFIPAAQPTASKHWRHKRWQAQYGGSDSNSFWHCGLDHGWQERHTVDYYCHKLARLLYYTRLMASFSRTTWVSRYQKNHIKLTLVLYVLWWKSQESRKLEF